MDKPGALKDALTAMSHQELLDLVLKVASDRADFCRALLANISVPLLSKASRQVGQLEQQIKDFFESIQEQYTCNEHEYDEDERYPELDPIVAAAKTLHPGEQVEVFWHLITCGNRMFENERCPIGTQQIEEAIAAYAEAASQLVREEAIASNGGAAIAPHSHGGERGKSRANKQPYLDALVGALTWEMCGYGEVSDCLENAIATLCTEAADYRYAIAKLQHSDYARVPELIAEYYLKLGDEENYLKVRRANLKTEAQYVELSNYWMRKGEKKKYIATLEEGAAHLLQKRRDPQVSFDFLSLGSAAKPSVLLETLRDYYELRGDRENLCRILMATAEYSGVTLDLYQHVKTACAIGEQWQQLQPKLLALAARNPEALAQIYLSQADWAAAIQLARQQPHDERLQVLVAEGVKEHHPREAIEIYEQLVEHYIELQSRDRYRAAARHAAAIKSIYLSIVNEPDIWRQYIDNLRQRYPRHRALQEEFRRL